MQNESFREVQQILPHFADLVNIEASNVLSLHWIEISEMANILKSFCHLCDLRLWQLLELLLVLYSIT